MEDISTVYCYKDFWNCDSLCGLEIKRYGEKVTVVLTELDHNPGTSVTNMVEQLATMVSIPFRYSRGKHHLDRALPATSKCWKRYI